MTIISDLKSIDGYFTATLIMLFLSTVAPGVLVIYLFLPELFINLEAFKLTLFSASLGLPVYSLNFFILTLLSLQGGKTINDVGFQLTSLLSSFLSCFTLYVLLLIAYGLNLKFSYFLVSVCSWEIFLLGFVTFVLVFNAKKK